VTPAQHRAWVKRVQRDADREKLATLRLELKRARAAVKQRRLDARATCKNARITVQKWAQLERQRTRDAIELKRLNARHTCEAGRAVVAEHMATKRAKAERLAEVRAEQQREKLWSRSMRKVLPRAKTSKAESADEVRRNLSPDEAWLYDQVKSQLKPRPRMSPTEVFHHWLHEHEGDALRMLDERAQSDVRDLEEDERAYFERRAHG